MEVPELLDPAGFVDPVELPAQVAQETVSPLRVRGPEKVSARSGMYGRTLCLPLSAAERPVMSVIASTTFPIRPATDCTGLIELLPAPPPVAVRTPLTRLRPGPRGTEV